MHASTTQVLQWASSSSITFDEPFLGPSITVVPTYFQEHVHLIFTSFTHNIPYLPSSGLTVPQSPITASTRQHRTQRSQLPRTNHVTLLAGAQARQPHVLSRVCLANTPGSPGETQSASGQIWGSSLLIWLPLRKISQASDPPASRLVMRLVTALGGAGRNIER